MAFFHLQDGRQSEQCLKTKLQKGSWPRNPYVKKDTLIKRVEREIKWHIFHAACFNYQLLQIKGKVYALLQHVLGMILHLYCNKRGCIFSTIIPSEEGPFKLILLLGCEGHMLLENLCSNCCLMYMYLSTSMRCFLS